MHITTDTQFDLHRRMVRIRLFEEAAGRLAEANKLPGFLHLYVGEEAVAAGVCGALNDDDHITSTHRGHGHLVAKGGDFNKMMAELMGKATGYCKGKGGSMHITDMSIGMLGANGIVSGGIPIAVGAAYGAARLRNTDQVAVAFFGDGATNEGPFHEAVNMAAAWSLPVVFVCENNFYGVGTRLDRISPTSDLLVRAGGYKMRAVSVDGNDVLDTRAAALEAVAQARDGEGPTFIECRTFRQRGHFEGETPTYWDVEERDYWLSRDPIDVLRRRMAEVGSLDDDGFEQLDQAVRAKIEDAVNFAESSPEPEPASALDDIYA